ncbi:MAG: UDP-N-acetylmuramoyl-L-alanyl-D-glutamate--2,6-diaminopimelate ligase, partial [Clostridia bacterium]|nr:UDP-N-acetylmuramoyl-L-alanyl-D-glutamate--2,6-diaminopimelate ligase [Clostridia bacterium]
MKLSELFERAGVAYPSHMGELDLTGIETDSRRICAGSLFLCIRGMRSDGHQFIAKALANGAVAVVAETVHDACAGGAATILVEDTRRVASLLYHAWYGHPAEGMTLIGVTGTNGKTSVAWMLAEILESAGIPCGLIGTVCCRSSKRVLEVRPTEETANLTTPDPWELYRLLSEMRQDGVRYAVMEVTSHALALRKVEGLSFELGIFTNLSVDHLDFHGTMEDYFAQ